MAITIAFSCCHWPMWPPQHLGMPWITVSEMVFWQWWGLEIPEVDRTRWVTAQKTAIQGRYWKVSAHVSQFCPLNPRRHCCRLVILIWKGPSAVCCALSQTPICQEHSAPSM
jgi:hypothetical protein